MLQAARRVADGQLPYRDFLWPYGPAQPYLFGASFDLFGTSLLWWRMLRVACDAAVATLVYVLARRWAPRGPALAGWLAAACAMAQPTSATPFPALALGLAAVALATRREPRGRDLVAAGVLTGLAAAWRLDFGIYAGGAVLVALALLPGPAALRVRRAAVFAAAGWPSRCSPTCPSSSRWGRRTSTTRSWAARSGNVTTGPCPSRSPTRGGSGAGRPALWPRT